MSQGVILEKKKSYKVGIQTKNFAGGKIGNDLYYRGVKHY